MKTEWQEFEKEVAEILGLRQTIRSGVKFHDVGDATSPGRGGLICDAKLTKRLSFSLNFPFLERWLEQAALVGKRFIMPIRWAPVGSPPTDFVVLTLHDFMELTQNKE